MIKYPPKCAQVRWPVWLHADADRVAGGL